jgi:hypothetical protein
VINNILIFLYALKILVKLTPKDYGQLISVPKNGEIQEKLTKLANLLLKEVTTPEFPEEQKEC